MAWGWGNPFKAIENGAKALGKGVVNTVTAPVRVVAKAATGDFNGAYDAMKDVPIVGDGIDLGEGIVEGDMEKVAWGIGGLAVSAATMGTGSAVSAVGKNAAKGAVRNGMKSGVKQAVKSATKKGAKKAVKKAIKKEVKAQIKHEMKVEGQIITACVMLENPDVLEIIIRSFYKAGVAAGPYVLEAIQYAVENNPGMLVSTATATAFAETAYKAYLFRKDHKRQKRRCMYDHEAVERIAKSILRGLIKLVRRTFERKFMDYVLILKKAAEPYMGQVKEMVREKVALVKKMRAEGKTPAFAHSSFKRLVKVTGRAGWYLDSVTFTYSDGSEHTIGDTSGGSKKGEFHLNEHEYLVKIRAKPFHRYQGVGVTFTTNEGRTFYIWGSKMNESGNITDQIFTVQPGIAIVAMREKLRGVVGGVAPLPATYPKRFFFEFQDHTFGVIKGNKLNPSIIVGGMKGCLTTAQHPPQHGDKWMTRQSFSVMSGIYKVSIKGGVDPWHGKLSLYLKKEGSKDIVIMPTTDWAAPMKWPVEKTMQFTVKSSGEYKLVGEVKSKHPNAKGYWMCLNDITLVRA